jgi:hypothetical protein
VEEEARDQGKRWQEVKAVAKNKVEMEKLRQGTVLHLEVKGVDDDNFIIIISFMQGIYTHVPETKRVPREHSVHS